MIMKVLSFSLFTRKNRVISIYGLGEKLVLLKAVSKDEVVV